MQPPKVSCNACIVVDESGHTLWGRRTHEHLPNASTTKMVTALLVVQRSDLSDVVTVSKHAAATPAAGLELSAGDTYTVAQLLYALLLTSSNQSAVALAEHVDGSESAFVADMNRYAAHHGATDTHFVTPHGLDEPGHYSSARDLAHIGLEVLADPILAPIVATRRIEIQGPDGPELLENSNLLLGSYRGALGIKTGYTIAAGNVLVGAARRHHRTLVAVAMRSPEAFSDARRLLSYGFAALAHTVLLAPRTPVGQVVFDPGGAVPAIAARAVRGITDPRGVSVDFRVASSVSAPVSAGESLGTAVIMSGDRRVAKVPAVAADALARHSPSVGETVISGLLRATYVVAHAVASL